MKLIRSSDTNDRLACTAILSALVDIDVLEDTQKTRIASQLKNLYSGNSSTVNAEAVDIYGKLVQKKWAVVMSSIEVEVNRCLEWLSGDRSEVRKMTALRLIEVLCIGAPTSLYTFTSRILNAQSALLRDHRLKIRNATARTLGICLDLVLMHEPATRNTLFSHLIDELHNNYQLVSIEGHHAALLICQELMLHGDILIKPNYNHIGKMVLDLKDHRDPVIYTTTINILPMLAQFSPQDFIKVDDNGESLMTRACGFLIAKTSGGDADRAAAFLALARIAQSCSLEFQEFLEPTTSAIRDALVQRIKLQSLSSNSEANDSADAILETIAILASAMGQMLTAYILKVLDLMFVTGLSQTLCKALSVLAVKVNQLQPVIQNKLLDMLSIILVDVPFRPNQPSLDRIEQQLNTLSIQNSTTINTSSLIGSITHDILLLALRTLSTFDFRQENLFEFVHKAVLQYFDHSSTAVRKEAMCAASQLVLASSMHLEMSGAGSEVTGEVAQRLVAAAVTDLDSDVRLNAVKVLLNSTGFDFHMGRGQVIQSIALLVNDELFEIRLTVLSIIGRLASVNPANIIPIIHRIVTRLLVELEFADANSEREECVQLLTVLVCSAESWMRPHVDAIIHTILPRIDDCPPRLSSKLLDTVGILARISGSDLVPHLDRLLSRIINALSDQKSTQKRLSALRALGSCASFCGMVIDPYLQYPQIFAMLTDMLKSEPDSDVRLEVVRVIGALGAIDPHKYRGALETAPDAYSRVGRSSANVYGKTFTCDEHYTSVTVGVLLSILDDVSDTASDQYAVQALISMFVILKNACAPYLERVIPAILHAMRLSPLKQPEFFIRNLARLASINKSLIRSYAAPLLELYEIDESISDQQKAALIDLIEVLDDALSGNFGQHISTVLSFLIAVISANTSESLHITQRALYALQIISPSVESYLYLVVPRLISLLDLTLTPISTIKADLECISTIVSATDCSSFASRIVLTLVRMLQSKQSQPVQTDIMDTLCTLMENIQDRFVVFMPTISAVIKTRNLEEHAKYKEYSRQLFTGQLVLNASQPVKPALRSTSLPNESNYEAGDSNSSEQYVDESLLKRAWRTRIRMTKDDCIGWLNNLFVELLQQSPSPALRACSTNLAVKIPKLINELFNIAFVSCWTVLSEQNQQELAKSLEIVAANPNAPSEILQTILSLADFMERDGKKLPIDIKIIGNYASRCHALAKELRYKETEWVLGASYDTIEKLIELNQNLNLNDSAIGMLSYVRAVQPNIKESVEWYVRLQRWDEALAIYKRQEVENGPSDANLNGQIRCLFEMSDWESLVPIYSRIWCSSNPQLQQETAGIGVKVAWAVGDIDQMELCLSSIPNTNKEKPFCNALLSVYKNNFSDALQFISECRKQLETTLDSHSTDLYSQGYSQVFDCQMLTELEEVIEYKNSHKDYERQAAIVSTWKKRLDGIQPDVGMWQKLLRLHGMVLRPVLDLDTWIRYINLCRASGLMKMARRAIFQVLEDEAKFMEQQPVLIYSYLKYKWAANERKSAFQMLEMFSNDYANKIGFDLRNPCAFENHVVFQISSETNGSSSFSEDTSLAYFLAQIDYLFKLKGERIDESILEFYQAATVLDRKWYKAWHSLALRHYHETQKYDGEHADVPKEIIEKHVVPAVHGFFRAIQLSRSQTTLQDTLRLLTAWFTYAQHESVAQAVLGGLKMVPLRTWLQVIPQILARIHIGFESTNKLIRQLLVEVGKFHPHALLFSLYVAARSDHPGRSHAAKDVLGKLHGIYPELIEETEVVSRELIRVALPLPEMWVDEVIKVNEFIQTNDIAEGIKLLMPMHARMRTLETPYEYHFAQVVGKELLAAEQLLTQYYSAAPKNRSMIILHKAWDVYRRVHALSEQVSNTRTLYLDQVAPILLQCNSMHLAVPGTYDPDYEIVRIESFVAEMSVHRTKQRPREMYVCGSDGRKYIFLLKGHEDLRQDERAMQLFGLINSLLLRDDETARRSLAIERYPVIPLSPRSGLIGYYPNCNNLYRIIEKYRKAHNQSARLEQFVAAQFAPNYEQLSALQKVEAFEYVLASTKGNDLQHVMWYQSPNADVWLERRTNYTRTMAVMSIVGYILGLGDRHLSNIMMHMKSGKIVHIDFGDCFEVAAHRKQCPEKVPFRLTRMVILPMEVSMIEGLFKFTANHVMRVLRANRDPVMAVLEAFVFDPLVVWAYIQDSENNNNKQQQQQQQLETTPEAPAATSQGKQPQGGGFNADVQAEDLKARAVVKRIHDKLLGRDFDANVALSVNDQVDKLIQQATMAENLAPLFCGWQPFW
ncbi:armadillo-type protein [Coemansia spiralis]|nr:armadillo-type protein [Coemansia spiralis]